jgi:hypothetical protein
MKHSNFAISCLAALMMSGCSGIKTEVIKTPVTQTTDQSRNSPFIEAYLEYVGPPERWAGPSNLLVHLVAKDLTNTEFSVRPDLITQLGEKAEIKEGSRLPSSTSTTDRPKGQVAREKLAFLAESINTDRTPFFGCLYPVRARLIRADGSLVEKFGCRSFQGWASVASHTVSQMFAMELNEKFNKKATHDRAVAGK